MKRGGHFGRSLHEARLVMSYSACGRAQSRMAKSLPVRDCSLIEFTATSGESPAAVERKPPDRDSYPIAGLVYKRHCSSGVADQM